MIEYIVLAILQGIFEWLPISSSGQVMIISTNLFGIPPEEAFSLSIWLHLGTTLAIFLKFWRESINILKTLLEKSAPIMSSFYNFYTFIFKMILAIFETCSSPALDNNLLNIVFTFFLVIIYFISSL